MKRHKDALVIINPGACNPSGIAHSIIDACKELRDQGAGTAQICADPAVRLMVFQLAFICEAADLECQTYTALQDACEAAAN